MQNAPATQGHAPTAELCGARTRNGHACKRVAGWGTPHVGVGRCSYHGGATPTHITRANRELATRQLARFGVVVNHGQDPVLVLQRLIDETAANVEALRSMVAETGDAGLLAQDGRTAGLVALYGEWVDRAARIARDATHLGLVARVQTLNEQEAGRLARALEAGLDAAGVTPEQRELVRRGIATHLRNPNQEGLDR